MRTSVVITALATAAVAASRRRRPAPAPRVAVPVLPQQVRRIVEDDADLVLADQEARDERVLAALDAHLRSAG